MKKLIVCLSLVCFCVNIKAQCIINDKDGYVNVRKGPNAKSAIVGKLYIDDVFDLYDDDQNKLEWPKIIQQKEKDGEIEGYIHKSRIFYLSDFKTLHSKLITKDSSVIHNDSLTVMVKSAIFNPKKHKLSYDAGTWVTAIDDKHFWGTDMTIPKKVITGLKVTINGSSIVIPKNAFNDLYEPLLTSLTVYLGKNNTFYIVMSNSDGAGGYSVTWIIKNSKYLKRHIDNHLA